MIDRWLGAIVAMPKLHAFRIVEGADGRRVLIKRRRWWADLLVKPANRWLFRRCGVEALANREAFAWEREAHRALGVAFLEPTEGKIEDRELRLPIWPGDSLANLLSDPNRSQEAKRRALDAAIVALGRLHRVEAIWPDGRARRLSHGDAVAKNAIVDLEASTARWIDFDIRHNADQDPEWRHADDWRALIFSAAARAGSEHFHEIADAFASAQPESIPDATRSRFDSALAEEWRTPRVFRSAQVLMSRRDERRFRDLLLSESGPRGPAKEEESRAKGAKEDAKRNAKEEKDAKRRGEEFKVNQKSVYFMI